MTIIKQVAVTTPAHFANLARYLDDNRAIMHDSQNLTNEHNWKHEMEHTRATYGHDVASRPGAKNTIAFHQVIAFNADECSCNGGIMTPEMCMKYAQQWMSRYSAHEAYWCLHEEHCAADGSSRYAIHIAINRTNLETGKRLNEGRSKEAKITRANAIRDMDRAWSLRQVKANERNSRIHAIQPTRAEREMTARGIKTAKTHIRQHTVKHMRKIAREEFKGNKMRELSRRLSADGIRMTTSKNNRQLQFEYAGYRINAHRLGRGFSAVGIAKGLGIETTRGISMALDGGHEY